MRKTVFSAYDSTHGSELWITDGTSAGTYLLKDINPVHDSSPRGFALAGGKVVFAANTPTVGGELWVTDGTAAGTSLLKDINPAGSSNPTYMTALGPRSIFVADDGTHGSEPWVTDGTAGGTSLLADIKPGSGTSGAESFIVYGSSMLFFADDGVHGKELWITDGTSPGTSLLKDLNPGPAKSKDYFPGGTVFGGKVFFQARDGSYNYELWSTDGTAGGTSMFKDIAVGNGAGSSPKYMTVFGDKMLFSASDGTHGAEPWVSDGTAAGTSLLMDIKPGSGASSPRYFMDVGGKILFAADDGSNGRELWVTDLTAAGTSMLKDIRPGLYNGFPAQSAPSHFTLFGNQLMFAASDGTAGYELWTSDGTAAGTSMLADIRAGSGSSSPFTIATDGTHVFASANDGIHGQELWVSDGTTAGTSLLADTNPGTFGGGPNNFFTADVFVACFRAGTRIRTPGGEVAVEALRVGDAVVSHFGGTVPVRWIGQRRLDVGRHKRPWDVAPVRVRAGAFGVGVPSRDVLLSPDHAVFADGVLVPVRYLVNGRTIAQEWAREVTYFHVELPAHDVVLAEGLPCESYLDTGNRSAFANGGGAVQLHPHFAPAEVWASAACAPLVLEGAELAAVRAGVLAEAARLGHRLTEDPGLRLRADGRLVTPAVGGRTHHLRLPAGTRRVEVESRRWVPFETRAGETDTRRLGVAIADVRLDGRAVALDDAAFTAGWAAAEAAWRWTEGLGVIEVGGATRVSFDVALAGTYWEDEGIAGRVARG